jgi:PKD repeat protein
MKKIYIFLLAVSTLLSFTHLKANEVTVKGYVKFLTGAAAAGKEVYVSIETVQGLPCSSSQAVNTLADGSYTTKISCTNADILKVKISIRNCENQVVLQVKEVTSARVIEANFSICGPPPATCAAKFDFQPAAVVATISGFPFKFNSKGTETSAGDDITQRIWKFGDGEEKTGNVVDPTHVYAKPGTYNVCLTIRTAKGCSSTKCETIEIKQPCKANFTLETTNNGIRFNASSSSPWDNIASRTWNFGDGSANATTVDPLHVFAPGTYNVCLSIRTNSGCESRECKTLVIPAAAPPVSCNARYTFEQLAPKKFRFSSSSSVVASSDDNITIRSWDFGDGSPIVANEIAPVHEFPKPGIYQVCLRIKSAKGCESKICLPVKVEEATRPSGAMVVITTMFPTPATHELKTIIFSRNNNVGATVSIVNVYGEKKWSKELTLLQGNNPFTVPTTALLPGPYFLRVTTQYGTISKSFYKL